MEDKNNQHETVKKFIEGVENIAEGKNGKKNKKAFKQSIKEVWKEDFDEEKYNEIYDKIQMRMSDKENKKFVEKLKVHCKKVIATSEVFNHAMVYFSIAVTIACSVIGAITSTNIPIWIILVACFVIVGLLVLRLNKVIMSKTLILGVIEICEEEYKNSLEEQRNLCTQDEQSKQSKLQKTTGKENKIQESQKEA